ncbi:ABATE domain-containing protein [Bradyrhizobium sp. WYCCWR 13023]|uniref:ABATE domain-containing protein n=1 Tax=Bradyrhizobium zhengyangense TaxID=2911009 RepID=A0A9X1U8F4_9BRAD|nr:CGNR zinc finger domain-containing protein [Bradyrhizobium zhengyangense]MCG2626354.1 ABATE domain-containing protein [Bradyrhizobium zhengyangense]
MSRDPQRAATQFFGGRVCLDFANTLDWRTSGDPQELIPDYTAFLGWCARRRTLSPQAIKALEVIARKKPAAAAAAQTELLSLRAEIWSICDALRRGERSDLAPVNALLAQAPPQPSLVRTDGPYVHNFSGRTLSEPLWPILWSLTAVLTSADASRIGCCQADGCGWFYVDESPNRTRLWCSSEVCGNRERARRAYAKRRKTIPGKRG